jgi:hypothetical protein
MLTATAIDDSIATNAKLKPSGIGSVDEFAITPHVSGRRSSLGPVAVGGHTALMPVVAS